jgi:hypothetical protein
MSILLGLYLCQFSIKNGCILPIFDVFVLFSKFTADLFVLLIKSIEFGEDSNGLAIVFELSGAPQHRIGYILIIGVLSKLLFIKRQCLPILLLFLKDFSACLYNLNLRWRILF